MFGLCCTIVLAALVMLGALYCLLADEDSTPDDNRPICAMMDGADGGAAVPQADQGLQPGDVYLDDVVAIVREESIRLGEESYHAGYEMHRQQAIDALETGAHNELGTLEENYACGFNEEDRVAYVLEAWPEARQAAEMLPQNPNVNLVAQQTITFLTLCGIIAIGAAVGALYYYGPAIVKYFSATPPKNTMDSPELTDGLSAAQDAFNSVEAVNVEYHVSSLADSLPSLTAAAGQYVTKNPAAQAELANKAEKLADLLAAARKIKSPSTELCDTIAQAESFLSNLPTQ